MTDKHGVRALVRVFFVLLASAVSTRATALPSGFEQVLVASGLSNPTAMQFAPDGRLFVSQQGGDLKVLKNGAVLSEPFVSLRYFGPDVHKSLPNVGDHAKRR